MEEEGILIVVSGFSGAGKGSLMKLLVEKYENYALSVSATSRKPREGEEHGVHYWFQTKEEFEQLIEQEKLIEYAKYVDNYYGTPAEYVFSQMEQGKDVLLEIEIEGALQVKRKYPETILIFVTPPGVKELKRRLNARGTEEDSIIQARLERAKEEAKFMDRYDYIVVNDKLEECAEKLHELIQCQHYQAFRQKKMIKKMKEELAAL